MQIQTVATNQAPKAIGPYSQAVRTGNLLFCAGQIPLDPASNQIVAGGIREQTERVLKNIAAVLASQGIGLDHVVKTTVFMTNLSDFAAMNEVYGRYFASNPPARSTVQVASVPRGAQVEIEAVAAF